MRYRFARLLPLSRLFAVAAAVCVSAGLLATAPAEADDGGRQLSWLHPGTQPASKACPTPDYPADPGTPDSGSRRRVVIVGDSLTRAAYPDLQRRLSDDGWLPTTACWGGNQVAWGHQQLADIRTQVGALPNVVVVALGTNDVYKNRCFKPVACAEKQAAFRLDVRGVLALVGPNRHVLWVNTHIRTASALPFFAGGHNARPQLATYPAYNAIIADELARSPRSDGVVRQVVDWESEVQRYESTDPAGIPMTDEGIHYVANPPEGEVNGNTLRTDLILDALGAIPVD